MAVGDDNSTNILASLAGLQGAASLASGWAQSEALNAQASFAVSMAKVNQQFAGYRAQDVLRQGDLAADKIRLKGQQVLGAQRASAAAQGIRVDEGSAGDAEDSTRELSADDQITTRNNAWREAYGIQLQARQNVNQARLQQSGARAAGAATLLGGTLGALQASGKIAGYLSKTPRLRGDSSTLLGGPVTDPYGLTKSADLKIPGQDNDQFNAWWKE